MKFWSGLHFGNGDKIMVFFVLGIAVFTVVSGLLFIAHLKTDGRKDYLYDESDSFDQRQIKRWRF